LNFFPLPHQQGSLRPIFGSSRRTVFTTSSPPVRAGRGGAAVAAADRTTVLFEAPHRLA
jgi:hypothetical protein